MPGFKNLSVTTISRNIKDCVETVTVIENLAIMMMKCCAQKGKFEEITYS